MRMVCLHVFTVFTSILHAFWFLVVCSHLILLMGLNVGRPSLDTVPRCGHVLSLFPGPL